MKNDIRTDPTTMIIIILLVIIGSFTAYMIMGFTATFSGELKEDLQASDGPAAAITAAEQVEDSSVPIGDNLIFWFFIASVIGFWISSAYVGFSPVTLIIYVVVIVLSIFLSSMAADLRDDMKADMADFHSGDFTLSNAIFGEHMPAIIAFVTVMGLVIMYFKGGSSPQSPY